MPEFYGKTRPIQAEKSSLQRLSALNRREIDRSAPIQANCICSANHFQPKILSEKLIFRPDCGSWASEPLPNEALPGRCRRAWHNRRREHDPLGEGQPCTWRTRLIEVAALVRESTRRVVVQLSSSWPYLHHYWRVAEQLIAGVRPAYDSG